MKTKFNEAIESIRKKKRNYHRYAMVLVALAVFTMLGVNWGLHRNGISMSETYGCGLSEHTHGDGCYTDVLICGQEESAEEGGHTHTAECFERQLVCTIPEHTHTDACLIQTAAEEPTEAAEQTAETTAPETQPTEAPQTESTAAETQSTESETAAPANTEATETTATETTAPETAQTETKAETETTAPETKATENPAPETKESETTAPEMKATETTAQTETETNTEANSEMNTETETASETETETGTETETETETEEHGDPNADLESAAVWEATLPKTLKGVWAEDLISVAKSQLGYTESAANWILSDDGTLHKGYTRYGAWYGDPYGDWCAMFASFCLHYAGIPTSCFPTVGNCQNWIETLKAKDLYAAAGTYEPVAGDLIFFDMTDNDGVSDHVGIVEAVIIDTNGNVTSIYTIEGNSSNAVKENVYSISDPQIVGYGILPEKPEEDETETESETETGSEVETETETMSKTETETTTETETETTTETETETTTETETETETASETEFVIDAEIYGTTHTSEAVDTLSLDEENNAQNVRRVRRAPSANSAGVDMRNYITSGSFKKKNGVIWEESDTFTTADQVRGTINFENVYKSALQANNNTIYIDLPASINCSSFTGTYDTYDSGVHSGTYTYQKNADGTYRIVLVLDDNYVNDAGDVIGGSLQFNFEWTDEAVDDSGSKRIEIGEWSKEVKVTKEKKEDDHSANANYAINKSQGSISYDEQGYVYLKYDVTLTVKNEMSSPITLKDTLDAEGFTYATGKGVSVEASEASNSGVHANFGTTEGQGSSTQIQVWAPDGTNNKIPAGTYTITYYIKSREAVANPGQTVVDTVHNKIQVPESGDDTVSSETWTKTTTGTINKQGELVSGSNGTYIDYTVYLNAGDIIKNLKNGATFSDTLPKELELVGDVTVTQYDVEGKIAGTMTATTGTTGSGDNAQTTISYKTPTGQYYYIITYRTKLKDSVVVPMGGLTVKNEGKSTGDIEGSSSKEITIPNDVVHKKFNSQTLGTDKDGNWIDTISWTSTIDATGSLKGYTYEDWADLKYDNTDGWFAAVSMSDAQREAIVIKDGDGNVITSGYTVTTSDHVDPDHKNNSGNSITNGLFKIIFDDTVQGPITIEYETTVDMSEFAEGSWLTFVNWAQVTKDGQSSKASAQTTQIQYVHDNKNVVYKYGETSKWSDPNYNSSSITIGAGQRWIPWNIQVNGGMKLFTPLTVADVIPENLTLIEDSVKVTINGFDGKDVTWSYDEETRTLTVNFPEYSYYNAEKTNSQSITIYYRTMLPDDFFEKDKITEDFENTAKVTGEGTAAESTHTQTVTRQVVGKSGSYDETTKILSYNVVVNPEASTLLSGQTLTVTDTLDAGQIAEYIKLYSLQVFTAVRTTAADGTVKVEPGTLVETLTEATESDVTNKKTFTYTWDSSSNKFTTYLPDAYAYVIVAKYYVDTDMSEDLVMKNTVAIEGNEKWKTTDSSAKVTKDTSGDTHTRTDTVTVKKHDTAAYGTLLQGASFELDKYENNTWTKFGDLVTDKDGAGTFTNIAYNTLYKLSETAAPTGYKVDNGPVYFIVVRESSESAAEDELPDTISGESTYSKDAVKVYTVKDNVTDSSGKVTTQYYASIEIDRYNSVDKEYVKDSQLRVIKKWIDANGDEVTDGSGDSSKLPESVSVTLKKKAPQSYTVTFVGSDGATQTASVGKGQYIKVAYNNTSDFSTTVEGVTFENAENNSATYIKGISSDIMVNVGSSGSVGAYWFVTTAMGTADTSIVETTITENLILNAANSWTYVWENLESGDNVSYILTETAVDGYITTYQLNGTDLVAGAEFKLGTTGDKVTITNKANPEYHLPQTGGPGTIPLTAVGAVLMSAALLYGFDLKRRRERSAH